jgi:glycosyltransferase involved in cell wall biosynthesis
MLDGRRFSIWKMRPWYARLAHADLARSLSRAGTVDAVLSIGEFGAVERPHFIYQDHHYAHGLDMGRETGILPYGWSTAGLRMIERRAAQQNRTFASAAGVFTMSRWNADHLIRNGLVPADRVHTVHAGVNVPITRPPADEMARKRARDHREILFVGRDFERKGGDLVAAAFARVVRDAPRPVHLSVAGPSAWPDGVPMPPNTTFLGDLSMADVRERLRSADVLVMPSRFEAFGIIFVEALASGTPAIGRRAFAMPEMIDHGRNGLLVENDDPEALAAMMLQVVEDDAMAMRCWEDAPNVQAYYSWDRVASDMVRVIAQGGR